MEKFEVTILGCGSATPSLRHFPSSQVLNIREKLYMIDCGEGTQIQMRRNKLKFSHLGHIFISHIHGDHCFGLIGLISTFNLLGRTSELHIHAPEELKAILDHMLQTFCHEMTYKVVFHPIDTKEYNLIFEDRSVCVYSIPLRHRIACSGFLFKEKPTLPHIRRDMIDFYHIPLYAINDIKQGADWVTADGKIVPNNRLTKPAEKARSYAYCSDTIYIPELSQYLENIDLLYHEATFDKSLHARASETFHTTAEQAATLALNSHARQLVIGHYSSRYTTEEELLHEAKSIFPNSILAQENLKIAIKCD